MNILLIILIIVVIMDLGVNIFINIISNNNASLLVNLTTQINQERERTNKIINEYKEYIIEAYQRLVYRGKIRTASPLINEEVLKREHARIR